MSLSGVSRLEREDSLVAEAGGGGGFSRPSRSLSALSTDLELHSARKWPLSRARGDARPSRDKRKARGGSSCVPAAAEAVVTEVPKNQNAPRGRAQSGRGRWRKLAVQATVRTALPAPRQPLRAVVFGDVGGGRRMGPLPTRA